jgi:transcriptional regulator with XRE-family HTH domain
MLPTILQRELDNREISAHTAAAEIGTSHTTILRALKGERVDVETLIKIANWLKVRPSDLLNSMADTPDTTTADQLALLLSRSPELEAELKDAMRRVQAGVLDEAVIREIISYAVYKMNTSGETYVTTSNRGTRTGTPD